MSGSFKEGEIESIFNGTGIETGEASSKDTRNMEFSKLFLNLIGMASASHNLTVEQGFEDKEVFKEEIGMLREYVRAVKADGSNFLNFKHYPVKLMADLFNGLPMWLLSSLRGVIGSLINKGRRGKKKDLDEIEYYNGAVVSLGLKNNVDCSINKKLIERVKNK